MDDIDACVAYLHWQACPTCKNFEERGCMYDKDDLDFELHLGDFVLCSMYESK